MEYKHGVRHEGVKYLERNALRNVNNVFVSQK